MQYVRNQLKFLIQEIIFFDKHTSRMYSKIIGIAPLYALHPDNVESKETMGYFRGSVICWFAYDELRPYLAKQYAIPNGNDTQRMTFDDFFSQKLYASYLLGDSNMFNRMLLDYVIDPAKVRKEHNRIDKYCFLNRICGNIEKPLNNFKYTERRLLGRLFLLMLSNFDYSPQKNLKQIPVFKRTSEQKLFCSDYN
jgi:hypothetical protein